MGRGGALKDFIEYLEMVSQGDMGKYSRTTGFNERMPVVRTSGATSGRILKQSVYGRNRIPEDQIQIAVIREGLRWGVLSQLGAGVKLTQKNYTVKKNERNKRRRDRFPDTV